MTGCKAPSSKTRFLMGKLEWTRFPITPTASLCTEESSERTMKRSIFKAPSSTIWFLFSGFLNANVLKAAAAARCTFTSCTQCSKEINGGIPPSCLTVDLMAWFSCARFVMASAARLATEDVMATGSCGFSFCFELKFEIIWTKTGITPASATRSWWHDLLANKLMQ